MGNPILREKLEKGEFFYAPGVQDMVTAAIARKAKLDVVYGSGYWFSASAYGLPDAGLVTFTQMVDRMATLVRCSDAAVMADADTGFGGLLNVHHTIRGYEEAGVSAIQIEDQEFPKKCGHTPYKRVIPKEDMVEKIKVAVKARRDENMLIIARTDARQTEGLDGAIDRVKAYQDAGADILFVEALTTDEEMKIACDQVKGPMMANMANGGLTPMRTAKQMQELGYSLAVFPSLPSLVSAKAIEMAFEQMKLQDGSPEPEGVPLFNFKEFCSLIGFEEVWALEKEWGEGK